MSLVVPLFLMGAIGYVGQSFAYFTAVTIISASATSLLLYTYPTLVAILAWLIYREAFTRRKVLALVVASAGTLMVLGLLAPLLGFGNSAIGELRPEGVAWAAAASIIYSAYIIAGTRFTAGIAPIFASAVIISTAAAVYTVWGSLTGELHYNLTALGWVWAGAIALISTVIAITLFFAGLARVGPSRAAIASTIEPAVTVLLAAVVLGEAINLEQGVGGGLILASVIILQYRARKVTPE